MEVHEKLNKSDAHNPTKLIKNKIQTFKKKLDSLCDLSVVNVYETRLLLKSRLPSWEQDWQFLRDQRKTRKFYLGGIVLPDPTAIIQKKNGCIQT